MLLIQKKYLLSSIALLFLSLIGVLTYDYYRKEAIVHFKPDLNMINLETADELTIYKHTGLTVLGQETLRSSFSQDEYASLLMDYEEKYLATIEVICNTIFLFSREEKISDTSILAPLPVVEDGGILITFAAHTLNYRNGHAALVLDAETGTTLEAVSIGYNSTYQTIHKWIHYPNYCVLRLKTDLNSYQKKEFTDHLIRYANEFLYDIPYEISIGLFSSDLLGDGRIAGTQCSHLIWQTYSHFGINLDSDGGMFVSPYDLFMSPLLDIVQVYGIDPSYLQKRSH